MALFLLRNEYDLSSPVHQRADALGSVHNWVELDSSLHWNINVFRTNLSLAALVSLQPISAKYSRDADARDQWTRRVTGSRLVSVSSG